MHRTTAILAAASLLLVAAPARPDTFLLTDGDRVRGELQSEYTDEENHHWLKVGTPFGTVSFRKDRLKRRLRARNTPAALDVEAIVVTGLSGDVEKSGDGGKTWIRLSPRTARGTTVGTELPRNRPNSRVAPGDRLRTGEDGEADLDVGFGVAHIRAETELEFTRAGTASVTILKGEAGLRLDRLPKDREFRIETPQASMGVRGTTFLCRVAGATWVAVEDGRVDIGEVPVTEGRAAEATSGAAALPREQSTADAATFGRLRMTYAIPRFDWVRIPGGAFERSVKPAKDPRAEPLQTVTVPAFELAATEVTNEQYEIFWKWMQQSNDHTFCHPDEPPAYDHAPWGAPNDGSRHGAYRGRDPRQPVAGVSWFSAYSFCAWAGVRLPSEAEWTYSAQAGTTKRYWWGDDAEDLGDHEWYDSNCADPSYVPEDSPAEGPDAPGDSDRPANDYLTEKRHRPHPVATLPPNPFGLYDMLGNVQEFCTDLYHEDHSTAPTDGSPQLRARGARDTIDGFNMKCRVSMGGSWCHAADVLLDFHSGGRWSPSPSVLLNFNGFRVARETPSD